MKRHSVSTRLKRQVKPVRVRDALSNIVKTLSTYEYTSLMFGRIGDTRKRYLKSRRKYFDEIYPDGIIYGSY